MDLGGHEAKRADDGAVHSITSSAFDGAGEAEIDNLDIVELVKQDIFAFEVSVGESLCVDVMHRLNELLGVVSDDSLVEGARVGDIVKQLATVDKFTDNVGYLDLITALFVPHGILVKLEILHNVLVIQSLNRLDLVSQQLESSGVEIWVIKSEDLNGIFSTILSGTKLDLGAESRAKCSSNSVSSKCRSHLLFY